MRYATFSLPSDSAPRFGVVHANRISDVAQLTGGALGSAPGSLLDLIQAGPDRWRAVAAAIERALAQSSASSSGYAFDAVRWHAPIPRPTKNIVCLGLNYMSHVKETSKPLGKPANMPEAPLFFTKAPTTVNGPYDAVAWDQSATQEVDYEAELGVIVGVSGKNIPRTRALSHVFGYTVINDVSARDVQFRHKQWFKGKSLDGFCPMGPVVVTADEFGDPQTKAISLRVNGDTRQQATTGDMIFPVDLILEYLSSGLTLEAGDIIATGTPEGVGLGRVPPEYLRDGDVVETEIEGIGMLRNRIEAIRA